MVRTGFPGRLEHFVAYAGSAAIAMAGYGASRGGCRSSAAFGHMPALEYLQHFSPGRHPSIADFAASALGVFCGGLLCPSLAAPPTRLGRIDANRLRLPGTLFPLPSPISPCRAWRRIPPTPARTALRDGGPLSGGLRAATKKKPAPSVSPTPARHADGKSATGRLCQVQKREASPKVPDPTQLELPMRAWPSARAAANLIA